MQVDSARSDLRSQKEEILKLQEEVVKIHNIKDNLTWRTEKRTWRMGRLGTPKMQWAFSNHCHMMQKQMKSQ
jgi:hypothetical protein